MYIWKKKIQEKSNFKKIKKGDMLMKKEKSKDEQKKREKKSKDVPDYELKVPLVRDEQTQKKTKSKME